LLLRSAEVKPLSQRFVQRTVEPLSFYQGGSLGQVWLDLDVWAVFEWVRSIALRAWWLYSLPRLMRPCWAWRCPFGTKKPLAFCSALASAPLSDHLSALCWSHYWHFACAFS